MVRDSATGYVHFTFGIVIADVRHAGDDVEGTKMETIVYDRSGNCEL